MQTDSFNSNWSQSLSHFRRWIRARPRLVAFAALAALFAVLLTPAIWMLSAIPPLWRDVDAYVQVTHPPGTLTILHYGPLYPFLARIPLYLGYVIDCFKTGGRFPMLRFFIHPLLTDSGVFALLISQHIALSCATFYLITSISRMLWIRLILAITWAVIPLFDTFAHTIGAEALSMILLLLLGATGFRMVQHYRHIPRKEWILFAVLLWLSILTRHINAALAALMPVAFMLLGAYQLAAIPLTQSQAFRLKRWLKAKQTLHKAMLAATVGLGCIFLANGSVRVLCYAARIPYYSPLGETFLYRLKFLAALAPEKRNELLDIVTHHAASEDAKKVVLLLRESFPTGTSNWDVSDFNQTVKASLFTPQMDPRGEKYPLALNRVALAFIYSPQQIFLSAVASDFEKSQQVTIPDVVRFLFVTTRFYFSHREAMVQCASLVTFRDKDAAQVYAIFKNYSYFRHPKNLTYRAILLFWLINLALLVAIATMRKQKAAGLTSYAVALTLAGLFMMLTNCVLTDFQPRFTLPMWELTIISTSILSAKTMEYVFARRV
jgi:hypothetical protein